MQGRFAANYFHVSILHCCCYFQLFGSYLRSFKELVKQLNGCHTWRLPPDLLVVKGLDEYCQDYEPTKGLMQASTISALLQNCLQVSGTSIVTTSSVGVPQSLRDFYFDRVKIVDEQVQKDEEIILGIQN